MEILAAAVQFTKTQPFSTSLAVGALFFLLLLFRLRPRFTNKHSKLLPPVPAVPGLPVVGNLLQLKEKKPHKTFKQMAEKYGPIYSIRAGASTLIVLNTAHLAKQAMVARFSSISTRKLPNALKILTADKCMVATSDYNDFHKMVKKHILANVLGPNAQKRHRLLREVMMENMLRQFTEHTKSVSKSAVNFRKIFVSELFGLSLKLVLGCDVESIYVEEFGSRVSREELYKILVVDFMEGAIEVDWRDFFPYLRWIPNKRMEMKIGKVHARRVAVMKALMNEQKKRLASGKEVNCFFDYLMSEAKDLREEEMSMLLWEPIIETSDTTLVTTEWAMYEIARDKKRQEKLYEEVAKVCGGEKVSEEDLCKLPYLGGVFHETLRKHSPVPIVPLRYVDEDTELGGYDVPAGSEIAINIYACNMDGDKWESPEKWMPERFVNADTMDLYKTLAFGGGKRVCAGSLQAMLISCVALGRLVQAFEWELEEGEEDQENVDTVGLTTHRLHPLLLKLKPRTNQIHTNY